ncbi:MAG: poly(R)-hydroxyalkanoic acid synthase subunit PhaE, partial [Stenotrophomonas sp.]
DAAEEAYAKVALSEDFQHIYGELANAQMRLRAASQSELERACDAMGVPTRTEMDAAHRRIAELERQVRRLIAATEQVGPSAPAAKSAAPSTTKPAAKPMKRAPQPAATKASKPVIENAAGKSARKPAAKTSVAKKVVVKKVAARKSVAAASSKAAPARRRSAK